MNEAQIMRAMSSTRGDYVNRVERELIGALRLFYEKRLAKQNGRKYRSTFRRIHQLGRLLDETVVAEILRPIRGFTDRRAAFDEAVVETRGVDAVIRRGVERDFRRDYGPDFVGLNAVDAAKFWRVVTASVTPIFDWIEAGRRGRCPGPRVSAIGRASATEAR